VDLKTTDEGLLVTETSNGVKIIGNSVQTLSGDRESKTITKPGLVLVEATNSIYNVEDTGTVGDKLKFIRKKNNEGWKSVADKCPEGDGIYTMFRDGPTGSLYIGGKWNNNLGNVPNTAKLAKLRYGSTGPWEPVGPGGPAGVYDTVLTMFRDGPTGSLYIGGDWDGIGDSPNTAKLAKLPFGSTGPWEPVSSTGESPNQRVNTMFRDGPTGSLYIGGDWDNELGSLNTKYLAKLPFGSTGPWKPVGSTVPNRRVRTMFRDELSKYLYIGGDWSNIGVPNAQRIAKLPFGSTGPWEPVVETGGVPNVSVYTMFRDGPTGYLYIGGKWNNINGVPNTQSLAKLPFGSTGPWEAVSGSTGPNYFVYTMFKDEITNYLYIGGNWDNKLGGVENTQNLAKLRYGSTGPWEPVGSSGPGGKVYTMFRDEPTGSLYIGGTWTNQLGNVENTQNLAQVNETTNIIVNDTKYNIPNIGDTLEFVYANPWVKLNYSS
jgi:hypothetical protein